MAIDLKNSILLKTLEPLRPYVMAAGFFSFFINMLMIVPAIYMLQVYDRAVGSQSLSTLGMLTIIMICLLAAMGALDWVRGRIMGRAGVRLDEILSERVFNATFQQSLFTGGKSSAQPLSDLNGLRAFLSGPGVNAFFDTPWIPIYILIMFAFHTYFGILAIFSTLLLGTLTWINQITTQDNMGEANKEQLWTKNFANRHLRNSEVIESMGMMGDVRDRWAHHNNRVIGLQSAAAEQSGKFTSTSKALRIMLQSLALGMGAYLAINLEISPGMMIAGSILLGRALAPVDQLVGAWKGFQQARQQFERLEELLVKLPAGIDKMELPDPVGNISVEGIRVAPPGVQMPVLKGISFNIEAGTALGVIGPSAAGKSTLARAVLGLWPAAMGSVRLDGADIFKWDRASLGSHIGYLPQDIELFDGTISENIARFGEISSEKIVAAARMAGVHDMILRLPEGYDTVIGAAGGTLAGGQRQRIGLARALYGTPRLVVLDEPNSNLDDVGEAALRAALQQLKEDGVTVMIITHRPNILSAVDKILVMKDGAAADFGPAEMIMRKYQQAPAQQRLPGGSAS
jgi:ATP-binding cassette subfamily C protein EexD